MSGPDPLTDLPVWDSAAQQAGRQHAQRLAQRAFQLPAAWSTPPSSHATKTRAICQVGICGAGIMGAGIAVANLQHQIPVRLYDAAPSALERTVAWLQQQLPTRPAQGLSSSTSSGEMITACREQEQLGECDLVIESVVENREVKQRVLNRLAEQLARDALLATNTSTIPIRELATMPFPDRFCGLHFCNPVSQRRLVEVVRGELTSDMTVGSAVEYAIRISKLPVVVEDRPGFLVNRLLLPYLNEALEMVCQGADLQAIDQAARDFGMAMGPIELFDMIGVDTAMWAGRTMWEAFPDRIALTPVLPALVKRNRLGRKTGVGFYRYDDSASRGRPDPELAPILQPYIRRSRSFAHQEITWRLFLPMLVEATRVIEERVVRSVHDVDVGLLYGLAFPESRGGLLYWADSLGAATIIALLEPFQSLGKRMHTTPLLQSMARSGQRFYELVD